MAAETAAFERANPRSRALFERASGSLLDGVPMNWMVRWAGPFPLFVESASGARFVDVWYFDMHVKRARLRYGREEDIAFVPSWYGHRLRALRQDQRETLA